MTAYQSIPRKERRRRCSCPDPSPGQTPRCRAASCDTTYRPRSPILPRDERCPLCIIACSAGFDVLAVDFRIVVFIKQKARWPGEISCELDTASGLATLGELNVRGSLSRQNCGRARHSRPSRRSSGATWAGLSGDWFYKFHYHPSKSVSERYLVGSSVSSVPCFLSCKTNIRDPETGKKRDFFRDSLISSR